MRPPLVKNAADPEQGRRADTIVKNRRRQEVLDLQSILATPHGRRFLWRWINVLQSRKPFPDGIWQPNALMQFKAARHDVATELIFDIESADPDALIRMMTEARETERAQDAATGAAAQQNPDRASDSE